MPAQQKAPPPLRGKRANGDRQAGGLQPPSYSETLRERRRQAARRVPSAANIIVFFAYSPMSASALFMTQIAMQVAWDRYPRYGQTFRSPATLAACKISLSRVADKASGSFSPTR